MIRWILIAWVLLEFATYVLFLGYFSLLAAISVGLGSTLLGLIAVKAAGRRLTISAAHGIRSIDLKPSWNSGTFLIAGGLLLLAPGFLSDAIGVILLTMAALPIGGKGRAPSPTDIDLPAGDWRRLPDDPPR